MKRHAVKTTPAIKPAGKSDRGVGNCGGFGNERLLAIKKAQCQLGALIFGTSLPTAANVSTVGASGIVMRKILLNYAACPLVPYSFSITAASVNNASV